MNSSGPIRYRRLKEGGYELVEDAWVDTGIVGCAAMVHDSRTHRLILELDSLGRLTAMKGYRWDGASGPVWDRPTNMRAGLFHDGGYQLLRSRHLEPEKRPLIDALYRDLYDDDGGWGWLGAIDYSGLRWFAGYAAKPQPEVEVEVLTAP